jgi:hypothetical protein
MNVEPGSSAEARSRERRLTFSLSTTQWCEPERPHALTPPKGGFCDGKRFEKTALQPRKEDALLPAADFCSFNEDGGQDMSRGEKVRTFFISVACLLLVLILFGWKMTCISIEDAFMAATAAIFLGFCGCFPALRKRVVPDQSEDLHDWDDGDQDLPGDPADFWKNCQAGSNGNAYDEEERREAACRQTMFLRQEWLRWRAEKNKRRPTDNAN